MRTEIHTGRVCSDFFASPDIGLRDMGHGKVRGADSNVVGGSSSAPAQTHCSDDCLHADTEAEVARPVCLAQSIGHVDILKGYRVAYRETQYFIEEIVEEGRLRIRFAPPVQPPRLLGTGLWDAAARKGDEAVVTQWKVGNQAILIHATNTDVYDTEEVTPETRGGHLCGGPQRHPQQSDDLPYLVSLRQFRSKTSGILRDLNLG